MKKWVEEVAGQAWVELPGGSVSGDFIKTGTGRWESEKQSITAGMLSGPNREPIGMTGPTFEIVEGEYKGRTVYRAYENGMNHRQFLFRANSVEDAAKRINKG